MHEFKIQDYKIYRIKNIEKINTPALVVFRESVLKNIKLMKSYLEEISPNSGFYHLCPHVKTTKSAYIIHMMLEAGIKSFKCTPNEVDMLIEAGAKEIFVAYPLLEKNAHLLAEKINNHPDIDFIVQIGLSEHAEILNKVAIEKNITWNYFIDIDVGMHRTGAASKNVLRLFEGLSKFKNFIFIGLHGYDGHNHYKDKNLRKQTSEKSMSYLLKLNQEFRTQNIPVPKIMVAGSPSFRTDFEILYKNLKNEVEIIVSPGTWIYWDSEYENIAPGEFEFAALILAQVMDIGENQITLNLGHKRWAADQGEIQIFSKPDLKLKSFSEEHTVFFTNNISDYRIGDYILLVPRHVCPSINLYEYFSLIGRDGIIEEIMIPINARNR